MDYLASQLKIWKWLEYEFVTSFSPELSSITNEEIFLENIYKDEKLVLKKKLIWCLLKKKKKKNPSYKTVLKVGRNTNNMKFSQLAGVLKAGDGVTCWSF